MNRIITILIAFLSCQLVNAQIYSNEMGNSGIIYGIPRNHVDLRGKVVTINSETNDTSVVTNASVKLLTSKDSIRLSETVTNVKGYFFFTTNLNKDYKKLLIKVSAIGMKDTILVYDRFTKDKKHKKDDYEGVKDFGAIVLKEKTLSLEELKVVGELKKMFLKGDTLIYNTDAFKMPTGSVLLELVRRLPGIHFNEYGMMLYGDKIISEIKLNGQSFFQDNMSVALNNMPTQELEQLKVYDTVNRQDSINGSFRKTTVMDMKTKRDISKILFANIAAGTANKWGKYILNGDANIHLSPTSEYSVSTTISSLPTDIPVSRAIGLSMDQVSAVSNNDTRKDVSIRVNEKLGKKWNLISQASHDHDDFVSIRSSADEQYLADNSIFNLNDRHESRKSNENMADFRLNNSSRKMIMSIYGKVSRSTSTSSNETTSMSFTESPFIGDMSTDFSNLDMTNIKNRNRSEGISHSDRKSARAGLNISSAGFGLSKPVLSGRVSFSVDEKESSSLSSNDVTYYDNGEMASNETRNQWLDNPSRNITFDTGLSFSYRNKFVSIIANYKLIYIQTDNERNVFQIDGTSMSVGQFQYSDFLHHECDDLYRDSKLKTFKQDITSRISISNLLGKGWGTTVNFSLIPEHVNANTAFKRKENLDKSYDFFNWNIGTLISKRLNKTSIGLTYNASTLSPDIYQLLPITDNANPLFVTKGNPNLRNRQMHSASLNINRKFFSAAVNYSKSVRNIGEKTTYNEETGARERMLVNIKGGWDWGANIRDSYSYRGFSVKGDASYRHSVAPYMISFGESDVIETTRSDVVMTSLSFRYGNEKWDASAMVGANWMHNESDRADASYSQSVSDYVLRLYLKHYLNKHWDVGGGYSNNWRHGSSLATANGSDGSLNFCLRFRFLKELRGSLTLNAFDVLGKQRDVVFSSNATGNRMTTNDSMTRYILLTFAYKMPRLW